MFLQKQTETNKQKQKQTHKSEWSFCLFLIQEKKNLYQTLLCNTHTVFQAAESVQHPDLDVRGREFHDTT